MPLNPSRLRYWFAASATVLILVVAGFYLYARYRVHVAVRELPKKLGVEIQQSTDTFTLSKSEGGHVLFTIRASKAVQYKQGGRAELHDVNIVVYGHDASRFDQIYGSDFLYDPQSGNVTANGEVHIDLQSNSAVAAPKQATPADVKNSIHLKTSGLVFNQKTGLARTDKTVDFRIPQASGSAVGALYDSKSNTLTLQSDVSLQTTGENSSTVTAQHGVITKDPRRAVLQSVHVDRGDDSISADNATLFFRENNSIARVLARGNVQTSAKGSTSVTAQAPVAEFFLGGKTNTLQSAVMTGGVSLRSTGDHDMTGHAGRVVMDFGSDGKLDVIRTSGNVEMLQRAGTLVSSQAQPAPRVVSASMRRPSAESNRAQAMRISADAITFYVHDGKLLQKAETEGASKIEILPQNTNTGKTVITAAKFTAGFEHNQLSSLHGAPDARVVQSTPGEPDKVSTSQTFDATFAPKGGISGFMQQGNFEFHEGGPGEKVDRAAWAQRATYSAQNEVLKLYGSPRVVEGGMTTTASEIAFNRRTGDAEASGNVKTTYSELRPQPDGALLAAGDPVHVTADRMTLKRATGLARYTGAARLWQGANIIEAPVIVFNREKRAVEADAEANQRVSTVLVQESGKGKVTPVSVSADRLTYTDSQRRVRFTGGVVVRSTEGTMTSDQVNAYLKSRANTGGAHGNKAMTTAKGLGVPTPSELERIVAEGNVVLQEPNRRAKGDKLVYTAADGRFVMTGGPPTIYDAERGTVTGASLTFYSRDDRVLVESGSQGRTVTETRVPK